MIVSILLRIANLLLGDGSANLFHDDQLHIARKLSGSGLVLLGTNAFSFLFIGFWLEYVFRHLLFTLMVVGCPRVSANHVTSCVSSTLSYLRNVKGGYSLHFRGATVYMIYISIKLFLQVFFRFLFKTWGSNAVVIDMVVSIIMIPLHFAWTHEMVFPSDQLPRTSELSCVLVMQPVIPRAWEPKFIQLPLYPGVSVFGRQYHDLDTPALSSNGIFSVGAISNYHATSWADDSGQAWMQGTNSNGGTFINGKRLGDGTPCKLRDGGLVHFSADNQADHNTNTVNKSDISARVRIVNLPPPRPSRRFGWFHYLPTSDVRCVFQSTVRTKLVSAMILKIGPMVFGNMASSVTVSDPLGIMAYATFTTLTCVAWVLMSVIPEMISLCQVEISMIHPETLTVVSIDRCFGGQDVFTEMRCRARYQGVGFLLRYGILGLHLHSGVFGTTRERVIKALFMYVVVMGVLGVIGGLVLAGELRVLLGDWEEVRLLVGL